MKVFLTKRAKGNFQSIFDYLIAEWGKRVALAFEQRIQDFFDLLESFPEIGSLEYNSSAKQIRGFQLTKQVRAFYRIKNDRIIILAFFDVRQNPNQKRF